MLLRISVTVAIMLAASCTYGLLAQQTIEVAEEAQEVDREIIRTERTRRAAKAAEESQEEIAEAAPAPQAVYGVQLTEFRMNDSANPKLTREEIVERFSKAGFPSSGILASI